MVVGANSKKLIHSVKFFESMQFDKSIELYGGGNASNNIVKKIRVIPTKVSCLILFLHSVGKN